MNLTAEELLALIQGSQEWAAARVGYATSSEFSSILAKGQGKTRAAYLRRVACERLTGKPMETYATGAWAKNLERGSEQEPYARMAVEANLGVLVQEVGIIRHDSLMASCSCDGLIESDAGCEIKSVIPTVQLETILAGGFPSEHKPQIFGNLWLSKRRHWFFCSYSPDMPEHLRTYIFKVDRDEAYIAALEIEVRSFLGEVDNICKQLSSK